MISRVAEHCFWMHRYVERAENMARLLQVNRNFVLDVNVPRAERWLPVVVVSGEQERFGELYTEEMTNDGELVEEYLTWNEDNPVSLLSSLRWARENARTIREVISLEMWRALNSTYRWMVDGEGRRLYQSERDEFYDRVRSSAALFDGVFHNTILHTEPYYFMLLGIYLERAGQTARILDVKHHQVNRDGAASAVDSARSLALLRSCSATEPFFKHVRAAPSGKTIAPFLVLEERFPRSVLHCLARARACLTDIRGFTQRAAPTRSAQLLDAVVGSLRAHTAGSLFETGLHTELTRVIDTAAEICSAFREDYFDPSFTSASPTLGVQSQKQ
ncbi:alpha-E domain-containing protein [Haliangium ochraceum]|uniref:DUF403 domain-containing protein n=1 Tax=Haliangium ochraceum (strain DSM 14365 / JCM 11303 / SMP-2) TaxID=502025 RepID=D0LFZ2_HALO1|nr:alpha-E domain-containing protein [Haliangium ochraceum]ACY14594.1 protein of unknown function DUF403 [Haliangium ochraceum DSM 14365]